MSLRLRLFLLLAVLVLALVGTQALLVRSLAERLHSDVRSVAFRVGEEILSGFEFHSGGELPAASGDGARVFVFAGKPQPDGDAAPEGDGTAETSADASWESAAPPGRKLVFRREVTLREERSDGTRVERRVDVDAAHEGAPDAGLPRLEPGDAEDVLFLHGPAAGARAIPIPHAEVRGTLARFRSELFAGALALALAGVLAAALVADRATRPLAALAGAARRVGEGELGVEVPAPPARADEIGVAVAAFNRMSRRLAELDRENRRLAESERLSELAEVARGLAHTLRNPLNALGLSIEELAVRAAPGGAADAREATGASQALAAAARRQIERIDGTLRSFLALASADATTSGPLDLVTVAREVALEALQDGGGRARLEVEAAGPVVLVAVAAEIKAALQAVVVNAVEASPAGARVAVRVGTDGPGRARIEVDDAGPGLPAEVSARLFQPHVTTKPQGSGMGLFLAHRIVAGRYGGELSLTPLPGGGTRARIVLGERIAAGPPHPPSATRSAP